MSKHSTMTVEQRFEALLELRDLFPDFKSFLNLGMNFLGFDDCSDIQNDIADFLQYGPKKLMIQAQRGQAKTTILALYVIWCLIHQPQLRFLIVSAGDATSKAIAGLIIKIITNWDILECLRPDVANGDRSSVEAFDVNRNLRNVSKDASIACVSVLGNMTSRRADIIIADDIEAPTNSDSAKKKETLYARSLEFSDLLVEEHLLGGRLIYLGTPQSIDSIYNTLPSRGFVVRIWPGRYPTEEQIPYYNGNLAPLILERLRRHSSLQSSGGILGDQGQPTDPRLHENDQQQKEMEKGTASYQLQQMLNTTLSDKNRYPLKVEQLIVIRDPGNKFPMLINRDPRPSNMKQFSIGLHNYAMSGAIIDEEFKELQSKIMYIDPALGGKNADETGYCIAGLLNSNLFILEIGGIPGGYSNTAFEQLSEIAKKHNVNSVVIEKNAGFGMFSNTMAPILQKIHKCNIENLMVKGQKEKRIAESLAPIMGRGSLIFLESCIENDAISLNRYSAETKNSYSLFFQMSKLMPEVKGCLLHDDRLDALSGAVSYFTESLAVDQEKRVQELKNKELKEFYAKYFKMNTKKTTSIIDRYKF